MRTTRKMVVTMTPQRHMQPMMIPTIAWRDTHDGGQLHQHEIEPSIQTILEKRMRSTFDKLLNMKTLTTLNATGVAINEPRSHVPRCPRQLRP